MSTRKKNARRRKEAMALSWHDAPTATREALARVRRRLRQAEDELDALTILVEIQASQLRGMAETAPPPRPNP